MKEHQEGQGPDARHSRSSWRLRFRYAGERVALVERTRVPMIAPPSVGEAPRAGKNSGTWIEVRDHRDRPVFVRRLSNPFQTLAEHHSPDGRIEVVTRPPGSGEFEVIVPDLPGMRTVVLFSSPLAAGRATEPAREVARFSVTPEEPRQEQAP